MALFFDGDVPFILVKYMLWKHGAVEDHAGEISDSEVEDSHIARSWSCKNYAGRNQCHSKCC